MFIRNPKRSLYRLFLRFGLEVRRASRPSEHKIKASNVLALTISDLLFRYKSTPEGPTDFIFIQIGANDGASYDPIRRFVLKYSFRGLLVEPQPDVFERLKKNYQDNPNLSFANVAISKASGTAILFRFKKSPELPAWVDCLASFSKETLKNNFHSVRGEVEELRISAITLEELFRRSGFDRIDLLQIDTEGYDYEVLKMLEGCALRPSIINFEHGFLNPTMQSECFSYLNRLGYKVTNNGPDTVGYLEPEEQSLFDIDVQVDTPPSQCLPSA